MPPSLYQHQVEGIAFLTRVGRAILADDMGLGKTGQALLSCHYRERRRVLIVCPNHLKQNWAEEIEKWMPGRGYPYSYVIVGGATFEEVEEDIKAEHWVPKTTFTIINYEMCTTEDEWALDEKTGRKKKTGRIDPRHLPTLCKQNWDAVIVDEAHRIKNRNSKAFQAVKQIVKKLSDDAMILLLTGTPVINRPDELWPLLHIINRQRWSSYWKWVRENCTLKLNIWSGFEEPTGLLRPEVTRAELSDILIRRLKTDVLNLPEKTIVNVPVQLTKKQWDDYLQMEESYFLELADEVIEAQNALTLNTRLKQLAISTNLLTKGSSKLEGAKIDTLLELLEGVGDQRFVIFTQFAQVARRLAPILAHKQLEVRQITGDVPPPARQRATEHLNSGKIDGLIVTITAGGTGLNMTGASIGFFMDLMDAPAYNNQAVDRMHRIGQSNPVTVYNLYARGTVEDKIQKRLKDKDAMFNSTIPVDSIRDQIKEVLQEEYQSWKAKRPK